MIKYQVKSQQHHLLRGILLNADGHALDAQDWLELMRELNPLQTSKKMKNKFEHAVYNILNYLKENGDIVKEAIGAGTYAPGGLNSVSSNPLNGGNVPYSVHSDQGRGSATFMPQQSDKETDAPKIAPFPLETVDDQMINAYNEVGNIKSLLRQVMNNSSLSPAKREQAAKISQSVNSVLGNIKKIARDMSTIKI